MRRSTRLGCLLFVLLFLFALWLAASMPRSLDAHRPTIMSTCSHHFDMRCA